jgi:hypothetical protein
MTLARQPLKEREIRLALKAWIGNHHSRGRIIDEFWLPLTHERVDVVHVNGLLCAYEIKSGHDDLSRLPRQVAAFDQVFDRLVAVVDRRHLEAADQILPSHWGLSEATLRFGRVLLITRRKPSPNPVRSSAILLRLLWRSELVPILREIGFVAAKDLGRGQMWTEVMARCSAREIEEMVRRALLVRDLAAYRWRSRSTPDRLGIQLANHSSNQARGGGYLARGDGDFRQLVFAFNYVRSSNGGVRDKQIKLTRPPSHSLLSS